MTYQGWPNVATWMTALWLQWNPRRDRRFWKVGRDCLREARAAFGYESDWAKVEFFAIVAMEETIKSEVPASIPFRFASFLGAAFGIALLEQVSWCDLALYYLFDEEHGGPY